MPELDLEQHHQALRRRQVCITRLARYVREGRNYVVVTAHEKSVIGATPLDNPGYAQFAWRDDLRLQVEVQGDHYRDQPYSATQRRMLTQLGYTPPFGHGDDFCNWTQFREAEGCQPESVAQLLVDSLWLVFGAHFHDISTCMRAGLSHWKLEWLVSPGKRDIEAEIRARSNLI
jgi:hypothetical protein